MKKVTEEEFYRLKRQLVFKPAKTVVRQFGRSLKTVLQVKGSKTYNEYDLQNKAQHPAIKYSAREHLFQVHRKHFQRANGMWVEPKCMEQALDDINEKLNMYGKRGY